MQLNGDSTRENDRGPSLVASLPIVGLAMAVSYSRFLSCLGCSSQPRTQYYFPRRTLFHFFSRHRPATWGVRRAGSPVSVSLCGCCSAKSPLSRQRFTGPKVEPGTYAGALTNELRHTPDNAYSLCVKLCCGNYSLRHLITGNNNKSTTPQNVPEAAASG